MKKLIKISKTASILIRVVYCFVVVGLIIIFIWSDTNSVTIKIRSNINSTLNNMLYSLFNNPYVKVYYGKGTEKKINIIKTTWNIDKKIRLCKEVYENKEKENWCEGMAPVKGSEIIDMLIKLNIEKNINISLDKLIKSINNAEIKKEVDLDGDGKNEIFYMLGNENNIVLTEQKGKVYYLNFGTFICTKFIDVLKIKDTKRSVALILSTGTNGLNSELMYLIGLKNGKPEITFCTAESYKCELIDLDKDGVNEILCSSKQIIYGSSWPIIYKWNGETFIDSSLNFPEILKDSYSGWLGNKAINNLNKYLVLQSKEYRLFWEQNLLPLYKKYNKSESKNIK